MSDIIAIISDSVIPHDVIDKTSEHLASMGYSNLLCKVYHGGEVPKAVNELKDKRTKVDAIVWLSYPDACTYLDVAIGFWKDNISVLGEKYTNYLTKTLGYRPAIIHLNVSPVYRHWDPPHDQVCIRAWDSYKSGPYNFAGFTTSGSEFLREAHIECLDVPSADEKDPLPHPKELAILIHDAYDDAKELAEAPKEDWQFPKNELAQLETTPAPVTEIHAMWIVESATRLANWIEDNGNLPTYVRTPVGSLTPPRWSYLAAKLVSETDVTKQYRTIRVGENDSAGNTYTGYVTFETLKDMAKRYAEFIENNQVVPRYVRVSINSEETVGWKEFTYMLARTLRWYHKHANWPNVIHVKPVGSPWPANINDNATLCCSWKEGCGECDAELNQLATKLTDPNSVTNTVRNIAEYVAYRIDYAYYYNSRLGACGVLHHGYGNCCDQTNLLISLLRRAQGYWGKGIPCQYEHIYGRWGDGYYGHVRARVYLPDEGWVMIDPSMACGKFLGGCDYTTVEVWGRYRCLPFSLRYTKDTIVEPHKKPPSDDFKRGYKQGTIIGMGGAPKKGGGA